MRIKLYQPLLGISVALKRAKGNCLPCSLLFTAAPTPGGTALKYIPIGLAVALSLWASTHALADEPGSSAIHQASASTIEKPKLDSGDTAWMLVSTGLVLLMVPGLALFYGGMVRRKNVLGTMMHSMVALAIIGISWLLVGYALAFGKSIHGVIGWDAKLLGLDGISADTCLPGTHIPIYVHCMYQGMFAIIT